MYIRFIVLETIVSCKSKDDEACCQSYYIVHCTKVVGVVFTCNKESEGFLFFGVYFWEDGGGVGAAEGPGPRKTSEPSHGPLFLDPSVQSLETEVTGGTLWFKEPLVNRLGAPM